MPVLQRWRGNLFALLQIDQAHIGILAGLDLPFVRNPKALGDVRARQVHDLTMRNRVWRVLSGIDHQRQKVLASRNSTPDFKEVLAFFHFRRGRGMIRPNGRDLVESIPQIDLLGE